MRLLSRSPFTYAARLAAPVLALVLASCGGQSPVNPDAEGSASLGTTSPKTISVDGLPGAATALTSTVTIPVDTVMPAASDFAAGRILVKFEPGTAAPAIAASHARLGGQVTGMVGDLGVQIVAVPAGQELALVAAYSRETGVRYAEPDYTLKAFFTPNDTDYASRQWDMGKMACPAAWDVTKGATTVKVAVLDTGMDMNHGDLASKVALTKNFTSSSTSVQDGHGHGTHCCGTVAAVTNNAKGVAGVGFNTSLLVGKVLSDSGSGSLSWVASGVSWAKTNGAKVVSMSLGGPYSSNTLRDAIDSAWAAGVVVVAAAGNSNSSSMSYPGAYTNSIGVAATDSSDRRASFSNFGTWVDVAAPGVSIYSTYKRATGSTTDRYAYMSGTSMACPHVAGLAALVWATPHGTTAANVRARIENNCDPATSDASKPIGRGRVNAYKAVKP